MGNATVSVSLPTSLLADVDKRVDDGEYEDRSDAVATALEKELNER